MWLILEVLQYFCDCIYSCVISHCPFNVFEGSIYNTTLLHIAISNAVILWLFIVLWTSTIWGYLHWIILATCVTIFLSQPIWGNLFSVFTTHIFAIYSLSLDCIFPANILSPDRVNFHCIVHIGGLVEETHNSIANTLWNCHIFTAIVVDDRCWFQNEFWLQKKCSSVCVFLLV